MNNYLYYINSFLDKLYNSIESDGLVLLEKIGTIDSTIFDIAPLKLLISDEIQEVYTCLISSFIFLFLVSFSLKILLSMYKGNITFSLYSLGIKLLFLAIIACNSYSICKEAIILNSYITTGIKNVLEDVADVSINYSNIEANASTLEEFLKLQDKITINGFGESIICAFTLAMLVIFSVRYVAIILCIIFSPISIVFLLEKRTQFIFWKWLHIFIFNLFLQNVNVILLFIISVSSSEFSGALVIGTIIFMYTLNKKVGDIK